jgi:hypothetical protein
MFVEFGAAKLNINVVGCAVYLLCGAENFAAKTVGNHDVVGDGEAVHGGFLK